MKKKIIFILCLIVLFLCSCQKNVNEQTDIIEDESKNITYITANKGDIDFVSDFSILNQYETDVNGDGNEDEITLYINSNKDADGELIKNDNNEWILLVNDDFNDEYYTLFDKNIQVGDLYFQVVDFFEKDGPKTKILLYKVTGTEIEITSFEYEENKGFAAYKIYNTSDVSEKGINLKYSSIPHN